MIIALKEFRGLIPKASAMRLPDTHAQIAENCNLTSGSLVPWSGVDNVVSLYKEGTKISLFKYYNTYWFHWVNDANCVLGPVGDDIYKRAYITEAGIAPRMTETNIAGSGSDDRPANYYLLGIPAPDQAPTVTISGDPGEGLKETRFYVYTYVSYYGEEGPPSAPSGEVTFDPATQTCSVTLPSSGPEGNYRITHKRLYRTNTGTSGTQYQLTSEISVSDTDPHQDQLSSSSLGAVIPSVGWYPPNSGLKGLITLPFGSIAGFFGNFLCFSEPYYPHAWPPEYRIAFDTEIVAIGAWGSTILVTTKGMPYMVTGQQPGQMYKERMEVGQACLSKRGMVDMGYSLLYPAPDGLVQVGTGKIDVVTAPIMSRKEWQSYSPSTITGLLYDGKYVGFLSRGGGFVFDPKSLDFTTFTESATGGFSDIESGKMFIVRTGANAGYVGEWNEKTASPMTYTWRSKQFVTPSPTNFSVGQVFAETYPVTLKIYVDANATAKQTVTVGNAKPFPLLGGFTGAIWEIELTGTARVNAVFIANHAQELKGVYP